MRIVLEIFEKVERVGAKLLLVTKYLNADETHEVLEMVQKFPSFYGLGENRIEQVETKNMPREFVHFIGNIQSRKIPKIAEHCSVVHSLDNLEHAEKFAKALTTGANSNSHLQKMGFFLQINISRESQKSGVLPEDFPDFLKQVQNLPLEILGISAIGAGEFSHSKKRDEFELLKKLRDEFLPGKKISTGTSRDFELALEAGIDVVRVGKAALGL